MTLILRKCKSNGHSSRNFFYGNTGERVNCPYWNPEPRCGNGLHGLRNGNGNWDLLIGEIWLIIDADDQIVDIDEEKCKFNTGIVKFRGTTKELANSEFPSLLQLNDHAAYNWGKFIGNHDVMMSKITHSYYAYRWGLEIGNRDIMMHKINSSLWAYSWAYYIGNHDVMKSKVTDPHYIELWNIFFPNNQISV